MAKIIDISKVVLIFGSFVGIDNILELFKNLRYKFLPQNNNADTSWKGGQSEK